MYACYYFFRWYRFNWKRFYARVLKEIITKEIPGFGEIFRHISFKKIGTSSLQSRAIAGLINKTFIFALPGSPGACQRRLG